MEWWLNFLGWFLSVTTAVGNGFVIFLIAKTRRLHSSGNWFVLSLAISDFCVGFALFPSGYLCSKWRDCNFRAYIAFYWFFLHSSVLNLCTLTWDRYIAIVHPLRYHTSLTARRPPAIIAFAWFIPFAISLFLVLGMYATSSLTAWKIIRLTGVSAFNIPSSVALFYAVIRILIVQVHHNSTVRFEKRRLQYNHSLNQASLSRRRRRMNAARFIIAIVLVYLGCYVAVNYIVFCMAFSCTNLSDTAGLVPTLLLIGNSGLNPLIYACLKRDIKREIKRLLCRPKQQVDIRGQSGRARIS